MKDLRITKESDSIIDLSCIDDYFSGLIICYMNDKPTGYIQHGKDSWCFLDSINNEALFTNDSLYNLINILLSKEYCTNFKVIEFF